MPSLRQHEALINGIRIDYLEREPSPGTPASPLVLLHGLLATAETFADLIAGLPTERRIIAIDLLSAEPVDKTTHEVHFAQLTDLIYGLIQHLHLDQPTIIGHSHGGVLTLCLAARHRDLLKGMVLLAPAHPFEGYRDHVVNFYLTWFGRFLALCIPIAPSFMILRAYNEAAGPGKPIRMRHLRPYLRVLRDRNTLRRVLQMLATWGDDMALLRTEITTNTITTPTLLIWGEADPVVYASTAPALEAHLVNCELHTLPAKGHLLAEEAPAECSALINTWLTDLDSRP